jgi:phage terminase large subunit GpA-like protein
VVDNVFELGYQPEKDEPFAQWAYAAIKLRDSPYGEHFILEETPWLIAPLVTLSDGTIQEVSLMCCAQGGKTVFEHVALIWALEHKPGGTMFVAQTIDAAKEQAKGRILPMIQGNPALAALMPQG